MPITVADAPPTWKASVREKDISSVESDNNDYCVTFHETKTLVSAGRRELPVELGYASKYM